MQIDYDLHGMVGIRLLNATEKEMATVTRQLGPIQGPLNRPPDIIIRFVDELPTRSPIRYLGLDDVGYTDDAFLVLRSKHKSRAKVQIPFDQIGKQCEIICERGLPAVPYLIAIVNATALARGALPLHASAFTYEGTGIVVTGWAKGGKTEVLLAFMAHGATYVGDEWVYFSCDGEQIWGIPEPIRVWDWHLADLPRYRATLGRGQQLRLKGLRLLVDTLEATAGNGANGRSGPRRMLRRAMPLLQRQLYVHLPPQEVFGESACALTGSPDKIFFVASHEEPGISIEPLDPQELARRMVFCLQEEQKDFLSAYWKFRFAFPEAENALIEQLEERQLEALQRVLAGKETYAVYHPYPVAIPSLFDAIQPYSRKQD